MNRTLWATFVAFLFCVLSSVAFAQNAIVTENQLPGAPQSQWDLVGAGSAEIEGFATDISVNHGATVSFKIRTAATNWRIDIYRLGYYQGNGARLIHTINMSGAASQPTPIIDAATGLVDAGNWSTTASWAVPSTAVSGVYIAHLVNNSNPQQENQIPFVVRADESTSDVLFQTSDTTWHAYNGWPCGVQDVPSNNLYGGGGPGGDSAPGRAYKVSYNRPIATRDSCGVASAPHDYLFGAEYASIFWLERNGYNVSYIAGVDTARFPALLLNHKVFSSHGHDEYWDGVAHANVEAAHAAGVHLAFFSGNEVYWKTRWEPSIAGTQTNYRTLVCYKETRSTAPLDPLDAAPTWTWTGTWRDPRNSPPADGGKPENGLTGTLFQVDSYRSDAIEVPYEMSRLRFWRNTPRVAQAATGAVTTLTQNILGYEWDISPDNGFRRPGLINLSQTTLNVGQLLLDYGSMTGDGPATHNLTLYKHPTSGAHVFGAGTVFWSWGLSDRHDGPPTPVDADIQQATVNVLADMGVQPATLQNDLVAATASTDVTPPTTVVSAPANGASFAEGQPVTISGTASDVGGVVAGVEVSVDNGASWRRATGTANWSFGWNATPGVHTVRARATDDSLNIETPAPGAAITLNVSSGGATLFGSVSIAERQTTIDAVDVELGTKFSPSQFGVIKGVRFWKNGINVGPHVVSLWNASGNLLAQANVINETATGWQMALFPAPVPVSAGLTYTASYHTKGFYSATTLFFTAPLTVGLLTAPVGAGVYRYSETPVFPEQTFNQENYWVDPLFEPAPPTSPPQITSVLSANVVGGVPLSYQITATNAPTSFTASPLPQGLTLNPATGLISGTPTEGGTFNVLLGATNVVGTGTATLVLTISTPQNYLSLFSTNDTPALITVNDPSAIELGVKFVAASNGVIAGVRFYKGPQNVGTHVGHLWTAAGAQLASATFLNETASGWQTVLFAQPIAITAGTTYVASYQSPGFYSATSNFFDAAHVSGPLTAPASGSVGGNGVYGYGPTAFPTDSFNASNYWVDVLFTPDAVSAPVINSSLTANATLGAPFTYQITATNGPVSYGASPLPQGLSLNATTGLISGTPIESGTFNVVLAATNSAGTGSTTLVLTVAASPYHSLFAVSATPANVTIDDPTPVELGVKFVAASNGSIAGMRFYKGPQNTGAHSARLWSETGTLLANASFTNESASGWQLVMFAQPVAITAGTTYVASYHSNGFYSANGAFFTADHVNGPLTAPASATSGGNGVYLYGGPGGFPTQTFNATNYWVDALFQSGSATAPSIEPPLTASAVTGAAFSYQINATNSPTSYAATPLPAGLSLNAATGQITGVPTETGSFNIALTATNAAGVGSATLALTITAGISPPVIQPPLSASGALGSAFTYQIAATNNPTGFGAAPLPAGLLLNATTGEISGTPTESGTFNLSLTASNAAGSGSATLALNIVAPPAINSPSSASGALGAAFSYQITATNSPTSYSAAPLPAGLSINTATGEISGAPTASGTFNVTLGATNAAGTGSLTLALTILAPPAINGPLSTSSVLGAPFSYQINATNNPTSYSAAPLPTGLSVNTATGAISGTPTASGAFDVTLGATNAAGSGSAQLSLTIVAPPVVNSPSTASGAVGAPFNYQIAATNSPTSFGAAPLPGGLAINASTGVISGTPTVSGTFNFTISATNIAGTGTRALTLSVLPRYTLTVSRNNTRGNITSSPAGISCGSDCSESYVSGTSVTLTATPNPGRIFLGWSGACSGLSRTCILSMTANRSARASFL